MMVEVLIAARNSDSGYTLEGDVMDIRPPLGVIGRKERMNYIIILMDDSELPSPEELHDLSETPQLGRKHFYNIPLASIPGMNLSRARNRFDPFQLGTLDPPSGRLNNIPVVRTRPNRKL